MRRLVWFTLGFAAACFVGTYLAPGLWALLGAACAGFLAGGLAVRRYRGNVAAVAALCSLGLAVGLLWFCLYDGVFLQSAKEADGKTMPLELRILEYRFCNSFKRSRLLCKFFGLSNVRPSEHTASDLIPKSMPKVVLPCIADAGSS